ncbi:nuclear exosome regulator NRDE2 isoform X2 [Macrosteles quadrilineatus]|uniref:nuclear exosome regulator NRDE2 isoform X2 n=1 Tax=Macrosteles quadrilineatus TaxID=74068 RepID=UPI0023E2E706|nr:nuclear exosome regulator NRDE2 isoform X2 [Macrosteles quadrilineatus]
MSLFPAYKPSTSTVDCDTLNIDVPSSRPTHEVITNSPDLSWLKNTSYSIEAKEFNHEAKQSCNEEKDKTSKPEDKERNRGKTKKKKKPDKREKRQKTASSKFSTTSHGSSKCIENDRFYEDKIQDKGNFLVDTLYRPAIPRYNKYNQYFKIYKLRKKTIKKYKKHKRYYLVQLIKREASLDSEDSFSKEEELSKITKDFNQKLAETPSDIETWLDYVRFQNTVLDFEKTYRSGSVGGTHVMSQRQLAILERALQHNPANPRLLTMRLQLLELTLPPDQVADECSRALVQDPGCVPLWRALIRTSRNNMALCVAPAVLQQFSKALSRLGQLRVHRPPGFIEKDILNLMLECGLFLQQAGLWEQLITLLQMYLSLSLTASGQFTLPAQPQENQTREQEDLILSSGLPLSVLWLRIEKLRAAYHYLPSANAGADPQRVVFSEDLAGLVQPVMGEELQLQLVAVVFNLLKIPLLPTRHSTLECIGLLQIPSSFSNVEVLLAAAYPSGFSSLTDCRYLSGSIELVCEPQFVKESPGQIEFLSTVTSLLQNCAELLPTADANRLVVLGRYLSGSIELVCEPQFVKESPGQIEFLSTVTSLLQNCAELLPTADANRLVVLGRYLSGSIELVCEPQFVKESPGQIEFLSTVTSLLQNCAELLPTADAIIVHMWLMRLYALLCRLHHLELGAVPASIQKQARSQAKKLLKQPQFRDNLLLYSEYAMIERASGELDRACKVLETASSLPSQSEQQHTNVHQVLLRRRQAECLLLIDYTANKQSAVKVLVSAQPCDVAALVDQWRPLAGEPLTLSAALSPQLLVESLACHSLHLSLTHSVWDATGFLQQCIDTIPHTSGTLGSAWVEQLYEVLTDLLYLHTKHNKSGFAVLRSSLTKALDIFPNNVTLLNTLACLETGSSGGSPVWKLVSYFPRSVPLARLVLVFVVRHRISNQASSTGRAFLKNLLRQLAEEEVTRQCPLVWRLYLQLVAAQESDTQVKATFYKALQACPWFKALYIDAVKFLPEELPEVQDLLIEKELRLHTTPEELEILRD